MTYKQLYETENAIACQIGQYKMYINELLISQYDHSDQIRDLLKRIETLEECQKIFKKLLENAWQSKQIVV